MKIYAIYARLFAGATLITAWGLTDSPLSGVVLVLILTALSAIRYRFKLYKLMSAAEIAVCVGFAYFWLPALLGFWLPVIGFIEDKWREWERELLLKDFEDRAARLKLEKSRKDAALEMKNAARLAEINERSRIAQDIHDHVGHEITGALIALQTAAKLYESGDKRAAALIGQTISRLESASENLRETTHNLKPAKSASPSGISDLEELCDSFEFCETEFSTSGDLSNPPRIEVLTANLKEALTNVSRHSDASLVKIRLDGNKNYVRLTVSDNGRRRDTKTSFNAGLGLSGMSERVRAAGGTMTVNTDDGFKIICVLPKKINEK